MGEMVSLSLQILYFVRNIFSLRIFINHPEEAEVNYVKVKANAMI